MYALRVSDIPQWRNTSEQNHGGSSDSTIPDGIDINFEDSNFDLSLRRFSTMPPTVQQACPVIPQRKTSENAAQAKNGASTEPQRLTIHQRRRLVKTPRQNPAQDKQACNDISSGLRDPQKHHVHYTEDYPDPSLVRQVEDWPLPAVRPKAPKKDTKLWKDGKDAGTLPALPESYTARREAPMNALNEKYENPKHETVQHDQDAAAASDIKPKSKFKRGLSRVKSYSASLRPSAWTSQDYQRNDVIEQPPVPKVDQFAANNSKSPVVGFVTDEAMEHDRIRFARAFRSREAVRQLHLERSQRKAGTSKHACASAASSTTLRGGGEPGRGTGSVAGSESGGGGGVNRGFNGPGWVIRGMPGTMGQVLNMDERTRHNIEGLRHNLEEQRLHMEEQVRHIQEQMGQIFTDPAFSPFHRRYGNQLDDGTYQFVHEFDYDSDRDGPVGGLGRGGAQGSLQGGRRGGWCSLFGRRPRPGPSEAAGEDPLGMGFPELMGPMAARDRGAGQGPRGGNRGRGGRGDFDMVHGPWGGRGEVGMGYPWMGGVRGPMLMGVCVGWKPVQIGADGQGEGVQGAPPRAAPPGPAPPSTAGGDSETGYGSSVSDDDGERGDGGSGGGGGRGWPPPRPGERDPMDARDDRLRRGRGAAR